MSEGGKCTVSINGTKYQIKTVETQQYVNSLATEIEIDLSTLLGSGSVSVTEALVVLSLSYLDSYKKSEETADNLRAQIAQYLEEASKSRAEAIDAHKEIQRLQEKIKSKV